MSREHFDATFFIANRRRLRELFTGTAPIILAGNGLMQRNSDTTFPFRQDSNFWYVTGCDEPDLVLVIDKNEEYLIVPKRDEGRIAFDGEPDNQLLCTISGINRMMDEESGWKHLEARLKKVKHVATLAAAPAYVDKFGFYTNPARLHLIERLKSANTSVELLDLRTHFAKMRMVKQPPELEAIKQAVGITMKAFREVHRLRSKFKYEYEVEALLNRRFRQTGAAGHAYQPIVAGGARACTLHYVANNQPLSSQDLLLVDAGAEVGHYAADITRTFPLGEPSKRAMAVLEAVTEINDYATGILKPGTDMKEYEHAVRIFTGEKLRTLGLIKSIEPEHLQQYFPHATSHFLGLDVHDAADYSQPLEAGMVLTVEPGIYIAKEGIGVRIEDNVLITEKGALRLSDRLPRLLD